MAYSPTTKKESVQKKAQRPKPPDESLLASTEDKKFVQQVIGRFLYYACATDPLILHTLSVLLEKQAALTTKNSQTMS